MWQRWRYCPTLSKFVYIPLSVHCNEERTNTSLLKCITMCVGNCRHNGSHILQPPATANACHWQLVDNIVPLNDRLLPSKNGWPKVLPRRAHDDDGTRVTDLISFYLIFNKILAYLQPYMAHYFHFVQQITAYNGNKNSSHAAQLPNTENNFGSSTTLSPRNVDNNTSCLWVPLYMYCVRCCAPAWILGLCL